MELTLICSIVASLAPDVACSLDAAEEALVYTGALATDRVELRAEDDVVVFHRSHWHPYFTGETDEEVAAAVLDILSGRLIAYACYQGEAYAGGGVEQGTLEEAVMRVRERFEHATHVELKQWGRAPETRTL